jgi:gas vesicle protein
MNDYLKSALCSIGLIERSNSSRLTGFTMGLVSGAIAGAAIAVLLTPMDGSEMREQVGSKAKELAERTRSVVADATSAVKNTLDQAPEVVAGATAAVKDKLFPQAPAVGRNHGAPNRGV